MTEKADRERYLRDIEHLWRMRDRPGRHLIRTASASAIVCEMLKRKYTSSIEDKAVEIALHSLRFDPAQVTAAMFGQSKDTFGLFIRKRAKKVMDSLTITPAFEAELFQWAFADDARRATIEPFNLDGILAAFTEEIAIITEAIKDYFTSADPTEFEIGWH